MNGSENLVERIANLLLDDETSDVTLVVEGGCLPAHRVIVSTSCEYFRLVKLYSRMISGRIIHVTGCPTPLLLQTVLGCPL